MIPHNPQPLHPTLQKLSLKRGKIYNVKAHVFAAFLLELIHKSLLSTNLADGLKNNTYAWRMPCKFLTSASQATFPAPQLFHRLFGVGAGAPPLAS